MKIPKFDKYDGTTNMTNHIIYFEAMMRIVSHDSAVRCWAFVSLLSHKALRWYGRIPSNSVDDWKTFKRMIIAEFSCVGDMPKDETCDLPKDKTDLVNVKLKDSETNLKYFEHFKKVHD